MFVCLLHMTSLPSKQLTTGSNNFVNNTIKRSNYLLIFSNIMYYRPFEIYFWFIYLWNIRLLIAKSKKI